MLGYESPATSCWLSSSRARSRHSQGASYAMMDAYAGSTLGLDPVSIHPLLDPARRGFDGARTVARHHGDVRARRHREEHTNASLLAVGVVLILLVLFFPKGILGTLRERYVRWLP